MIFGSRHGRQMGHIEDLILKRTHGIRLPT
jgi:hypothetical protein